MTLIQTILAFLLALGLLVFFHELGHYLVARWCGVKVLRFSIGFGKPFVRWVVGPDKTEWTLAPIPLGGFVRMVDERDTTQIITSEDLPRAFTRQSVPRRMAIVLAGPVANFLLAIFLYAVLSWAGTSEPAAVMDTPPKTSAAANAGVIQGDKILKVNDSEVLSWNSLRLSMLDAVVDRVVAKLSVDRAGQTVILNLPTSGLPEGEVEKDFMRTLGLELSGAKVEITRIEGDSAASKAGLQVGDAVLAVDGQAIRRADQLINRIKASANAPLKLSVERDKAQLQIEVIPQAKPDPEAADKQIGRIGAALAQKVSMVNVQHGALEGIWHGAKQTWSMSIFSLRMMGKMIMGDLSWKNLSGPVTIADYAGQSARISWQAYVNFLALISVSLGVLNLLPIPVLDGGHLVYYGIEGIRGRPLSDRVIELTQRIGIGLIGAMMVVALFNDLTRVFGS